MCNPRCSWSIFKSGGRQRFEIFPKIKYADCMVGSTRKGQPGQAITEPKNRASTDDERKNRRNWEFLDFMNHRRKHVVIAQVLFFSVHSILIKRISKYKIYRLSLLCRSFGFLPGFGKLPEFCLRSGRSLSVIICLSPLSDTWQVAFEISV